MTSGALLTALLIFLNGAFDPDSLTRLKNAAEADPANISSRLILIEYYIENQNFGQAELYLKQAQAIDSLSAAIAYLWGRYHDSRDNLALAMENYNLAIGRDSTLWQALRARAYLHEITANYESMLTDLEVALRYTNDSAAVFYDIGVAHDYLGEIEKAGKSYERAVECGADFPEVYINLGAFWADMGNYDSAGWYLNKALDKGGNSPELFFNLGKINYDLKNYQMAIADFYNCLAVAPDFVPAKYYLGYLFEQVGDTATAIIYLEDFVNSASFIYRDDINRAKEEIQKLKR